MKSTETPVDSVTRVALPVRLAEIAAADPDRRMITDLDSGESMSRGELHAAVLKWAGAFHSAGVRPGDRVVTILPTSARSVAIWLGISRLRAIDVPLNTQYRGDMLRYVLDDAQARIVVVHERFVKQVAEVLSGCGTVARLIVVGTPPALPVWTTSDAGFLVTATDVSELPEPQLHDIAAIIYTSGTTGRSKGVLVPWAQLQITASWAPPNSQLSEDDVIYAPYAFFHISARSPHAAAMHVGASVVLRERFSTSYFWPDIKAHHCTYTGIMAGMTDLLLAQEPATDDLDNPLRSLAMVPAGSSFAAFEERFDVRIGTLFTMTEVSVPLVAPGWRIVDPASCGQVRAGCQVRLVDEFDREVPVGWPGEMIVRTDEPWALNAGYWNKPEETAHAWRNGWFHTGDVFRRDEDGNFFFIDRRKDAIRRRGENISSMEVEDLIRQHPGVQEVAVVGQPSRNEELGFTDEEVRAFVVRRRGSHFTAEAFVEFLRPRMPLFMLPRFVDFVGELPKTPSMKIRKVELRERSTDQSWDAASR
jgi:crotonobetaine/carnitine-CoA ligase